MAPLDLVRRLGGALASAVAPNAQQKLPGPPAFGAVGKLLALLPVTDILAVIEGRATVDTELDLAERAAGVVAAAFPPGAIAAGEVEMALKALQFLLDAAGVGPKPFRLKGGVPASFPPGGGPGPYRGR